MIKLGSQEVTKIMKGSDEVLSVYKDNDEIWSPDSELYYGTECLSGSRECYWTISAGTFPTNRFTVETWFKALQTPNHGPYASFFGSWKNPTVNGWMLGYNMDGQKGASEIGIMHQMYSATTAYGVVPGPNNMVGWNHIAFVKTDSTITIYINGENKYSFSSGGYTWGGHDRFFGPGSNTSAPAYGTFSNYRVSNMARYTSNFGLPASPFAPDGNTIILSHCGDEIKDYSNPPNNVYFESGLKVTEDTPWTPKVRVRKEYEEWGPIQPVNTDVETEDLE